MPGNAAQSAGAPAAASMCKEGARARAGRVYSWPPRACRASLGIARRYCVSCRARRGQRERGKLFVRVVCCCAVRARRCVHHSGIAQLFTTKFAFGTLQTIITFYLLKIFFEVEGEIPLHPLSLAETTALHYDSFCEDFGVNFYKRGQRRNSRTHEHTTRMRLPSAYLSRYTFRYMPVFSA